MLDPSEGVALFTDGSAYHGDRTGGWAWVAVDIHGDTTSASGRVTDTTIGRMEIKACLQGLLWAAEQFGSIEVLVYSDSEYVVKGAMDRTRKRRKNKVLWSDLDDAIALHEYVEFEHVKGHNDNLYNELADKMAGKARKNGS